MSVKILKNKENLVDNFSDMEIHAEESLRDIWDNKRDKIWGSI